MSLDRSSISIRIKSEVIDDNGDVVLVVGPDKARTRISSTILMRASRVFAAMFSGTFAEGTINPTVLGRCHDYDPLTCSILCTSR